MRKKGWYRAALKRCTAVMLAAGLALPMAVQAHAGFTGSMAREKADGAWGGRPEVATGSGAWRERPGEATGSGAWEGRPGEATGSDASEEWRGTATGSDAAALPGRLNGSLLRAPVDLAVGVNAEEKHLFWGDKFKSVLKAEDKLSDDAQLRFVVEFENPETDKKEEVYHKLVYARECRGKGRKLDYQPEKAGDFTAQLQDDGGNVIGEIVEFDVAKANLTVEFLRVLQKKSGNTDPGSLSSDFIAATNDSGNKVTLTVSAELVREAGEKPGMYEITDLKLRGNSENLSSLALKKNAYSYLKIEKGTFIPKTPGRIPVSTEAIQNESEVTADVAAALKFPADGNATGLVLGELSAEDREKFAAPPAVSGTSISFAVKKSAAQFEVWLPVTVLSENYEDCEGRLHLVWEEIAEENGYVDTDKFPVCPVGERASYLSAYAGYGTTFLIFGTADSREGVKTVQEVYRVAKEYTKDMRAFFFDVSQEAKGLGSLASARGGMVFCSGGESGVDYAKWRRNLLAQYGQGTADESALSVFLLNQAGDILYHKADGGVTAPELRDVLINAGKKPDTEYARAIREFKESHEFQTSDQVSFEVLPDSSVWREGAVSRASLENGLNALNFIRFVAGVPCDVKIDDGLQEMAQKGSVLMAKNGALNRYPDKPSGMPDEFYNRAAAGVEGSNLYRGEANLAKIITGKNGYMDDGDSTNKYGLRRRRWCLNPAMEKTGMGYYNGYSAMYATDVSGSGEGTGFVAWPAQVMPGGYFSGKLWSVSLNRDEYYNVSGSDVEVTVKGMGKTLHFGGGAADGFFAVNTEAYGSGPAVIFSPDVRTDSGCVYDVSVSGLKSSDGAEKELRYTVKFFSMDENSSGGGGSGGSGGSGSGGGTGKKDSSGGQTGMPGGTPAPVATAGAPVSAGSWERQADGKWKLRLLDGAYASSRWAVLDQKWYLLDADGIMASGWRQVDGAWYCFSGDGSMMTGWRRIGDSWYYLAGSGAMASGWRQVDGKWYYLAGGGAMVTGWLVQDDKQYYLDPADGSMAVGDKEIGGKLYHFSGDGVLTAAGS